MIKEVNAIGDVCPLPVAKAKKALEQLGQGDILHVLVDNETAVKNLERFASSQHAACTVNPLNAGSYCVIMEKTASEESANTVIPDCMPDCSTVIAISANKMGEGDEVLGKILIKGFIFALTQLDSAPSTVLLYNSGAYLSTEGSESLEDLKTLQTSGTEILTCGTCLNHYHLEKTLAVGEVTNMYTIAEKLASAGRIINP